MNPYKIRKNFNNDRSKYIGASDIPVIALPREMLKPYHNTRLELYLQKRKEIDIPPAGDQADLGNEIEPLTLYKFLQERYGIKPNLKNYDFKELLTQKAGDHYFYCKRYTEFTHPEYPFLKVHPDMVVFQGTGTAEDPGLTYLVQAKSHKYFSAFDKDAPRGLAFSKEDFSYRGIPIFTYFQEQFEMLVSGIDTCFVEVEADNSFYCYGKEKIVVFENDKPVEKWNYVGIKADPILQAKLLAAAVNFWKDCKEGNTPKAESKDIEKYYTTIEERSCVISDEAEIATFKQNAERYRALNESIKEAQSEQKNIKSAFKLRMGYNEENPEARNLAHILKTPEGEELATFSTRSGSFSLVAPLEVLKEAKPAEYEMLSSLTLADIAELELTETQQKALEKINLSKIFTKETILKQLESKTPELFTALKSSGIIMQKEDTYILNIKGE